MPDCGFGFLLAPAAPIAPIFPAAPPDIPLAIDPAALPTDPPTDLASDPAALPTAPPAPDAPLAIALAAFPAAPPPAAVPAGLNGLPPLPCLFAFPLFLRALTASPPKASPARGNNSVSYTHLRAHET